MIDPLHIDWRRVAEPQEDQYDTQVALHFATTETTPLRPHTFVRHPVGNSPAIFDGVVAVRYLSPQCPDHPICRNGPLRHPNIEQAASYVRRWPAAFRQFQTLMDSFHPMADVGVPLEEYGIRTGSRSHSVDYLFGAMFATVFCPVGLAEAFVHEMAHNKLRALGVSVESASRLVTNPPGELYESPIRKDVLRPMTAVLHAQYSFMYVTQLNLKMIEVETENRALGKMLGYLSNNVPRMEQGYDEMRNIQVDEDGRQFVDGFVEWSDRVISQGNELLQRYGVKKQEAVTIKPLVSAGATDSVED